jgi:DNA-binding transcriptional MerR regulator
MAERFRLDELAREAGVPTTTVRLYQNKGLLPGPELVGRTGWYDGSHLARLRLIARLQDEGFSLTGIRRLLETWEEGRSLQDIVGMERQLDALFSRARPVVLAPEELLARFPIGALTSETVQRAAALRLIEATADGRFVVSDERFLTTGAALLELGVPADVVLDEWDALVSLADTAASRFIDLFERWMLPKDWRSELTDERARELSTTLGRLRGIADEVIAAAMDASVARIGADRLAEITSHGPDDRSPTMPKNQR